MPALESPATACPVQTRGGIDPVVSERIAMVRFPLIMGVVLVHCLWWYKDLIGVHLPPWANYCGGLVYEILPLGAVPLFTLISGYLYFRDYSGTKADYLRKNGARFRTLVLPYLIWNILVFGAFIIRGELGSIGYFRNQISVADHSGVLEYANQILGGDCAPSSTQFWFVRNLIVLCLLSPLAWLLIRNGGFLACGLMGAAWLSGAITGAGHGLIATIGYSFFLLGGCIAQRAVDVCCLDRWWKELLLAWLGLACITCYYYISDGTHVPFDSAPIRLLRLFGCIAVWTMFSQIGRSARISSILVKISGLSFFVFAMHDPLLNVVTRAGFWLLVPLDTPRFLLVEIAAPVLVVGLVVSTALSLRRYCQPVFNLLGGQRGMPRAQS